ncbi:MULTISPECIES: HNH endonuclease [unclassified Bacillus cereus group]|uniref:HNH endonuclease n=1 Tax=unclassified Bacillus cereus group TaxID=2750818 RepID=UPI0011ED94CB|nr:MULTISPECIES: HNH endonuclease [unclassified Bacillus cereus group]QEL71856.1 HNH endonuclease [Bacillus sp. AR4-2]QEL77134.1 HNH endonuclease [Bacillus sp. SH8-8]
MTTRIDGVPFRANKPTKRKVTYDKDKKYQDYRSFLKEDFGGRCGYCNSYYGIVKKDYHIDHFVPKKVFEKLGTHDHLINDYENLIYSCPSCNRSKSGKWPSGNPDVIIYNDEGFVNPCSDDYDTLFYRDNQGKIIVKGHNKIGEYIYRELKLFLGRHQTVWKIETLMDLIKIQNQEQTPKPGSELLANELMVYLNQHFEMDKLK